MDAKTRNILFIHCDAMVRNSLSVAGNEKIHTPNIDSLAGDGTMFTNAFTCNGVCVPSRCSLITGRYPIGHGVVCNYNRLTATEITMPKLLKEHGYCTGYFGKTHLGGDDKDMPGQGWGESFLWQEEYNDYLSSQGVDIRYPEGDEIRRADVRYWNIGTSKIPTEHYFENVIADKAIEFIQKHKRENFFCFVGNVAPHGPFSPPVPYDTMYDPAEMELLPRSGKELENKPPTFVRWIEQNQKFVNADELKIFLAAQYGLVSLIDDNVGRLIRTLKEEGLFDSTLIVFTADHGDFASKYGVVGKSWCSDDILMGTPLVISHPEFRSSGETVDSLVENVDVFPTLLDYAEITTPERVQGTSLVPLINGEKDRVKEAVFSYEQHEYSKAHHYQSMIRTQEWKLVQQDNFKGELYNMKNDPWEWNNLIDDARHRETVTELRERLLGWHIENSGLYYDTATAGYWEDRTNFYGDEPSF